MYYFLKIHDNNSILEHIKVIEAEIFADCHQYGDSSVHNTYW